MVAATVLLVVSLKVMMVGATSGLLLLMVATVVKVMAAEATVLSVTVAVPKLVATTVLKALKRRCTSVMHTTPRSRSSSKSSGLILA